jgi:NACHT domain/Leucine Rich repeats (2 copies)
MIIELASALVAPLAKLFLKSCLGEVPADIGDHLLKLGFERFGDWSKARTAKQLAERTAASVVTDLERFFASEHVDPNLLEVAATDLGTTVGNHVDAAFLVDQQLDAAAIEAGLLEARPLDQIYPKGDPARDPYARLVKALAPRLRAIAPKLPHYELERDAQFFAEFENLADNTGKILAALADIKPTIERTAAHVEALVNRPKQLAEGYEADYLEALCTELNRVEIIGLSVDEPARGGELEVAYLSLRTRLGILGDTQSVDFATMMTLLPELGNRVLIEGPAGSGKSTLLRWAAIRAARFRLGEAGTDDPVAIAADIESWLPRLVSQAQPRTWSPVVGAEDRPEVLSVLLRQELRHASWCVRLPFLVPLRRVQTPFDLGSLHKLVADLAGEPTDQWVNSKIKSALLMFDGVDEVPVGAPRRATLQRIEQWATRFPQAQVVVTSRPGALGDKALAGFTRVELDELSDDQKGRFVDHWHQALGLQLRWTRDDAIVVALGSGVRRELAGQRALNDLAANPLLCASLCALHWDRRREAALTAHRMGSAFRIDSYILPSDRWEVCEALVQMLLQRREQESLGFDITAFPEAYRLNPKQKRAALVRIAYGMAENDMRTTMLRADAVLRVEQALVDMRGGIQAAPDEILDALLERSGVLRASEDDAIEFVHNTIKAYLAAHGYLTLAAPATLIRKVAHAKAAELASGLDEVAVFCAASPTGAAFAKPMMEQLLQQADRLPTEQARLLRILAVRCEAAASTDFPPEARQPIIAMAPVLFPPRTMDEARQLAALGEEGIPRLAPRAGASDEEAAAAVRCLRLIGSQAADAAIDAYRDFTAPAVLEELAQVRHPLTLPSVLDAAQDYSGWQTLPASVKARLMDVEPLAGLANLQRLFLSHTRVTDLRPLEGLTNLRTLELSKTQVANVRPLEGLTNLQRLDLDGTPVADLRPLEGLINLQVLSLSGTEVTDVRSLEGLTNLQTLDLSVTQVADVKPLERLLNLGLLVLTGTLVADARPLEGLTKLRTLFLDRTQVADVRPLEGLTNLRSLGLSGTPVADEQVVWLQKALPNLEIIR